MFKAAGFGLTIVLGALVMEGSALAQEKDDVLSSSGRTPQPAPGEKAVETPKADVPSDDVPKVIHAWDPPEWKPTSKMVSVKAESEVLVEHRDGANTPWKHICASPCSFTPAGGDYRVIGVNVSPSEPFAIKGAGALKIDIGSAPKMRRGMVLTGIGTGLAVVGLVLMIASSGFSDPAPGGVMREEKIGLLVTGTILTFSGAGVGIYGGATYYENRRSEVTGPVGDIRPRASGFTIPLSFTF